MARSTCPVCKGSGKRGRMSFVDPLKDIISICNVCYGKGTLPERTESEVPTPSNTSKTCPTCRSKDETGRGARCADKWHLHIASDDEAIVCLECTTRKPDDDDEAWQWDEQFNPKWKEAPRG